MVNYMFDAMMVLHVQIKIIDKYEEGKLVNGNDLTLTKMWLTKKYFSYKHMRNLTNKKL